MRGGRCRLAQDLAGGALQAQDLEPVAQFVQTLWQGRQAPLPRSLRTRTAGVYVAARNQGQRLSEAWGLGESAVQALAAAALGQRAITEAPAVLVLAGVYQRTAAKYGARAERYVTIEVGAVAENVYLQCESLGLSTVLVGAFRDEAVGDVLQLPEGEAPYAIMPIGLRRSGT